jgi:[acyl-carrier-protein] S-malonyltransferase
VANPTRDVGADRTEGGHCLLAFTFPGQGSQRPGMGASWVGHPSWELVEHASEIVGRDVVALLLEADQETLTRTENAQLATFVLSLVVLDATERLGLSPAATAGHSLGEYTALVASGAISYEDGLRLVQERGSAMQDAADSVAGSMLAVLGLDDDDVEAVCVRAESEVWAANFNSPGQVIISGSLEGLERASELAKAAGARRVLSLPVGGAFHTPLMAPARDRLRKALAEVSFHEADPVVVANVDARPHPDSADWPGLLSAQLVSPVRWRQSLENLYAAGMRTFVELGPGNVLSGMAKRALEFDDVALHSVSTPDELEALVAALAGVATERAAVEAETETYEMTERLLVSPATGPFMPSAQFAPAMPQLLSPTEVPPIEVAVGDLVGHAGETEIRSAFAGELKGIIVLSGERVVTGQPVAWLRVRSEA